MKRIGISLSLCFLLCILASGSAEENQSHRGPGQRRAAGNKFPLAAHAAACSAD